MNSRANLGLGAKSQLFITSSPPRPDPHRHWPPGNGAGGGESTPAVHWLRVIFPEERAAVLATAAGCT